MRWENIFSINVKNYKSLKDVSLKIKPITVLVGPNGSGKSSLIGAIKLLVLNLFSPSFNSMKFNVSDSSDFIEFRDIIHKNDINSEISIKLYHEHNQFDFDNSITGNDKYSILTTFDNRNSGSLSSIFIEDLKHNTFFRMFPIEQTFPNGWEATKYFEDKLKFIRPTLSSKENSTSEFRQDNLLVNQYLAGYEHLGGYGNAYPRENINIGRNISVFGKEAPDNNFKDFYQCWDVLPFFNSYSEVANSYLQYIFNGVSSCHEFTDELKNFIFRYYREIPQMCSLVKNAAYIDPVRNKPKYRYQLKKGKFDKNEYYGIPFIWDESSIEWYPYEPLGDLKRHVNQTLQDLGIARRFDIEKRGDYGYTFLELSDGTKFNLAEANSGTIQLLPIIFNSYLTGYTYEQYGGGGVLGSTLLFIEQPELHLHPKLQTQLADFVLKGLNTFVIETHSEHFLRKLQIMIAQNPRFKEKLAIYYFDNSSGETRIKEMEMEDNGFFKEPWPDGFFDEASDLAYALLEAQIGRKN
jgi:predicted ATPase